MSSASAESGVTVPGDSKNKPGGTGNSGKGDAVKRQSSHFADTGSKQSSRTNAAAQQPVSSAIQNNGSKRQPHGRAADANESGNSGPKSGSMLGSSPINDDQARALSYQMSMLGLDAGRSPGDDRSQPGSNISALAGMNSRGPRPAQSESAPRVRSLTGAANGNEGDRSNEAPRFTSRRSSSTGGAFRGNNNGGQSHMAARPQDGSSIMNEDGLQASRRFDPLSSVSEEKNSTQKVSGFKGHTSSNPKSPDGSNGDKEDWLFRMDDRSASRLSSSFIGRGSQEDSSYPSGASEHFFSASSAALEPEPAQTVAPHTFNETFLFDDDLEPPSSSYTSGFTGRDIASSTKQQPVSNTNYRDSAKPTSGPGSGHHMTLDDDHFPILVRRDDMPGMLSVSSAALDLANLSSTAPRNSYQRPGVGVVPNQSNQSARDPSQHTSFSKFDGTRTFAPRDPFRIATKEQDSEGLPAMERQRSMTSRPDLAGHSDDLGLEDVAGKTESDVKYGGLRTFRAFVPQEHIADIDPNPSDNHTAYNSALSKAFVPSSAIGSANFAPANQRSMGAYVQDNVHEDANLYGPGSNYYGRGQGGRNAFYDPQVYGSSALLNDPSRRGARGLTGTAAAAASAAAAAAAAQNSNDSLEGNRYANTPLEDLRGDIYSLCKDQHGCRYLQKKLEEQKPEYTQMIFDETYPQFAELMVDPFGNYLTQRLIECVNDEQRNMLVDEVSSDLLAISLNMHGTRAVQKMVECLSTPHQIHSVVMALSPSVVTLIKDLNSNHVVQKCLNRLSSNDNQFIYNAVSSHCVEVATHRHGCCVLQRCIDHASEGQKIQLVTEIIYHAFRLVQDPFGNYAVQYVLDLNEARFNDAAMTRLLGNVCSLCTQKFSSNVIEKCIRVASPKLRKLLIDEMLDRPRLERLLRDSFANYCVQTALDCAEPAQRIALAECIRPLLPGIRNTPYGKRIANKLQREGLMGNVPGARMVPIGGSRMSNQYGGATINGTYGGPHNDHLPRMHPSEGADLRQQRALGNGGYDSANQYLNGYSANQNYLAAQAAFRSAGGPSNNGRNGMVYGPYGQNDDRAEISAQISNAQDQYGQARFSRSGNTVLGNQNLDRNLNAMAHRQGETAGNYAGAMYQ